jgi:streptogramin lyase
VSVVVAMVCAQGAAGAPVGAFSEFPIPTANSEPVGITAGPDGNVWFTELAANKIGRITPGGTISEFPIPTGGRPGRIAAGPDGNLWFTAKLGNKIGRFDPRRPTSASTAKCVVPKLKGKALTQAKQLLRRAHCKLGRVTKPAKHKNKLVVVSQKPAAKKILPSGAKVSLRLG